MTTQNFFSKPQKNFKKNGCVSEKCIKWSKSVWEDQERWELYSVIFDVVVDLVLVKKCVQYVCKHT